MLHVGHNLLKTIHFQGKNVREFLQGQLTTDTRTLKPQHIIPTTLCQYQGKMLGYGHVSTHHHEMYLHFPESICHENMQYLKPYAQLNRITMSISESHHCIGIVSESPLFDLQQLHGCHSVNPNVHIFCLGTLPFIYGLYGPIDQLNTWLEKQNTSPLMPDVWQALLIKSKQPIIGAECRSRFTPNMLGLVPSESVSLNKGCYVGQEIIARTYHLGKVKKQLVTCTAQPFSGTIPSPGEALTCKNTQSKATCLAASLYDTTLWLQLVTPKNDTPFIPELKTHDGNMSPYQIEQV
ncbi:MAG: hypothetical protein VXY77_02050 [Pseudomonadota bacterium]|nr:hypothetical protein [Pseudomonadota bacterium]